MIFNKECYDFCSPSYKKAIDYLENQLASIQYYNNNAAITQLVSVVTEFSKYYFTPSEYWNYVMQKLGRDIHINHVEVWKTNCRHIAKWALFHLCYNREWNAIEYKIYGDSGVSSVHHYYNAYGHTPLKLLDFQNDFYFQSGKQRERVKNSHEFVLPHLRFHYRIPHYNCENNFYLEAGTPEFPPYIVTEQDLVYPHNRLQECMHEYEKRSYPSSRLIKQYQEMIPLYHKIKYLERNAEEWFNALLETRDVAFVIHNVERRIGLTSLFNIKLWKLYIDFLEEQREYKLLLETYSKYCRFFLDDKEMKEKYKAEMIKYGFHGLSTHKVYSFNVK